MKIKSSGGKTKKGIFMSAHSIESIEIEDIDVAGEALDERTFSEKK